MRPAFSANLAGAARILSSDASILKGLSEANKVKTFSTSVVTSDSVCLTGLSVPHESAKSMRGAVLPSFLRALGPLSLAIFKLIFLPACVGMLLSCSEGGAMDPAHKGGSIVEQIFGHRHEPFAEVEGCRFSR